MKKSTAREREPIKYVAFLRGINVGGHKSIKMDQLQKSFEALGFQNVKTVLASGNVLFEAQSAKPRLLTKSIEKELASVFGFEIGIILRTIQDIQGLADNNPFKNFAIKPETLLYVTFLSEKPTGILSLPYESPDKTIRIFESSSNEIFSFLHKSQKSGSTELMKILEKEFGRNITTRNWNTVEKILEK